MTPEQIAADTLYQRAVLRVYGPWLTSEVMASTERRRALARVQHARLILTMREPETSTPAEVTFNETETPNDQEADDPPADDH